MQFLIDNTFVAGIDPPISSIHHRTFCTTTMATSQSAPVSLPRIAITYCTQCRWMLRAAYFAQELLTTFSTTIGEVALVPASGGLFTVELTYVASSGLNDGAVDAKQAEAEVKKVLLWDRKTEGGFPETKVLKQLVRDHLDPGRDLGHSDKYGKKKGKEDPVVDGVSHKDAQTQEQETGKTVEQEVKRNVGGTICEDCN
ncbi:hypothetical protein K432DRAFT_232201 [Lepidopterella palustris CBS 459.81]|uniref:Rdx family-domain-containing protein n=1 Tax=Lepidopterella palustris CBS 459.81 TaxID=1314670 RepID=A0A8E2EE30_9PEZI|nr:hypothetical protein K432DRAFT_232201 [Lepidopterella palustris CBS 459.81]